MSFTDLLVLGFPVGPIDISNHHTGFASSWITPVRVMDVSNQSRVTACMSVNAKQQNSKTVTRPLHETNHSLKFCKRVTTVGQGLDPNGEGKTLQRYHYCLHWATEKKRTPTILHLQTCTSDNLTDAVITYEWVAWERAGTGNRQDPLSSLPCSLVSIALARQTQ